MGSGYCLPPSGCMPGFQDPMAPIPLWGNYPPPPPPPMFFGGFGIPYGLPPQLHSLLGFMAMFSGAMGAHSGCFPSPHACPPQPMPYMPPMGGPPGGCPPPMPGGYPGTYPGHHRSLPPGHMPEYHPSGPAPQAAQAALSWANGEMGVSEYNSPDRVRAYSDGAWQPWCADFVSTAIEQGTGRRAPWDRGGYNSSSVAEIRRWGEENGRFIPNGAQPPQQGDVIILQGRGISHTGFVQRIEGDKVVIISGNSSDKVKESTYHLNDPAVAGFVRPWDAL